MPTFVDRGAPLRYTLSVPNPADFVLEAATLTFGATTTSQSGGYRVITFYAAYDIPVFLLDVYSKDAQANLSQAQLNELRKTLTALPGAWREQKRANTVKHRRRT